MDRQDHEEQHAARDPQSYERRIRQRGIDAGARSFWADSDWDATKRAFGEARIRELRQTAAVALGSEAAADAWLEQPEPAMGGMTPRTCDGALRLSGPGQTAAHGTRDAKRGSASSSLALRLPRVGS
jgi:hypothetical protein